MIGILIRRRSPQNSIEDPSTISEPKEIRSKNVIVALSIIMALQMTSFVIILPLFARRFTQLNAGVEALGISEMAYALTSTLAAPFLGALADRIGRKSLVLIALAAYVFAFSGYLLASSANVIILLRGLAGVFTAGLLPAVTGLAADLAPADRRSQWIGFITGGASFGWIAGPVLGGMIFDRWGYCTALVISILLAATAFIVALLALSNFHHERVPSLRNTGQKAPHCQKNDTPSFLAAKLNFLPHPLSSFLFLLVIFFAVFFAWAFVEPRFMFYAYNDLNWNSSMLGLVMSAYGFAMTLGEFGFGRLSDRLGRKPVIMIGLLLSSVQFIALAFFSNHILIAIFFAVSGLGNALYDPALSASILDISPAEHRAGVLGIKSMVGSSGNILGPALASLLSSSINTGTIFLISACIVLIVALTTLGDLIWGIQKGFSRRSVTKNLTRLVTYRLAYSHFIKGSTK